MKLAMLTTSHLWTHLQRRDFATHAFLTASAWTDAWQLYDISTPELCQAMSLLAFKPAYWFPKLSISVGRRTWSYDGEPEETYDAIIENAAGGCALRMWNCGPTSLTDAQIDDVLSEMCVRPASHYPATVLDAAHRPVL